MKYLCTLLAFLIGCTFTPTDDFIDKDESPVDPDSSSSHIQPYSENPRYWQYKNEPVLLIGGSIQDNLFQIPDISQELNTLSSVGGNYIRNTMSSRDEGDVWEFHQREDGKYDLEKLNEEYYDRFKKLLELAYQKDIIVQIELWDRFDYAREPWLENPFRPENNINYSPEEIGLKNEYPEHPAKNINPFFRSIPEQDNNQQLLKYQEKRVNRILDISLEYPNVLYVMDNETSANPDWGTYWARFIQDRADEKGIRAQTTEMWNARSLKDDEHKQTLDYPELYEFADVSQNSHQSNQTHWDNLQWARNYVSDTPRPINNVKIYGSDLDKYGDSKDAVERFWRNIIGGSAGARFHRPTSGIGLGSLAQTNLLSASQFISTYDIFSGEPDSDSELLENRSDDEAYLNYNSGQEYAVYFTDGGSIELDLREESGTYTLTWLHIDNSEWSDSENIEAGKLVQLKAPGEGQWIALLEKL